MGPSRRNGEPVQGEQSYACQSHRARSSELEPEYLPGGDLSVFSGRF
jgi:hypothetical protein